MRKPVSPGLMRYYSPSVHEAGCDEAGRGCLAGPVVAAAVVLDESFNCPGLNDSKQLNANERETLSGIIKKQALAWAVAMADHQTIDKINILQASFLAMHRAIEQLNIKPQHLLIDGNRFLAYADVPHMCIVKGDSKYMSIAAASILAKTYRDEYMMELHQQFPHYGWNKNKGYPTRQHIQAIDQFGYSPHHRLSFTVKRQLKIDF